MSIQKKSLIGNLTAAKKAIVANVASVSQAKLTPTKLTPTKLTPSRLV